MPRRPACSEQLIRSQLFRSSPPRLPTGEIEALDATLSQLRVDLVRLDAAIRIMSPATDPEAIRPRKPSRNGCDWFGRGELARMVLDVLREAQGPLGHAEIARAIMERKGLPVGDAVAVKRVAGMVKGAMRRQAGRMVETARNGREVGRRILG